MQELEDWELRVGRADPAAWETFQERMAECRGVLAALLSSDPGSIALTHSATEGLNIACGADIVREMYQSGELQKLLSA